MDAPGPAHQHTLRSLLTLAWPIVLARATQSVIGFTDALFIAPLGEAPLAAVTTGSINIFTFIILPMGTVFILQSFAAQLRGRGDLEAIPRYAYYGLVLAALASLVVLLATPGIYPALRLMGYEQSLAELMASYLGIRLLSVFAAVGMEALGSWYGGLGNTRPSLVGGVTAMTVNVALNYVLVQPRFGLPGYGVAGSAWASVIASWLGFGVVAYGFWRGRGYDKVPGPLDLRMPELKRVLRFGLPNGFNWFLEFAAFALFINVVIGHLGTTTLAAFNVVMQINSVSFMPAFGLASAGAILAGEAIGRRSHDEVVTVVKLTGKVAGAWMGAIGLIYFTMPTRILSWFGSEQGPSEELLETGAVMLGLSAIWQLFDAISITLSEALRSAGDTTWCMAARLVLAWLVFTPISWLAVLSFGGGVYTVMTALIMYLALLAAAFVWRFLSGKWREIDLVGEPSLL
jgi:MATE family multidrug resistance protein